MATVPAIRRPSAIDAFRSAQAQLGVPPSRPPAPPPPPIEAPVARADQQAQVWDAAVVALATAVSSIAAVKLAATKDPAYAKIISAATQLQIESQATVTQISAAGAAILAAS